MERRENRKAKITLTQGSEVLLVTDPAVDGHGDEQTLFINYARLAEVVEVGTRVLLDDGLISLEVQSVGGDGVRCVVLNSNAIGERKGVNLPGVVTGLPAMSDKDKEDIRFGIEKDMDFVAASFVRSREGVQEIREHIAGAPHTLCHGRPCPSLAETADETAEPGRWGLQSAWAATGLRGTRRLSSSRRSRTWKPCRTLTRSSRHPTGSWWPVAIWVWNYRFRRCRRSRNAWCASAAMRPNR